MTCSLSRYGPQLAAIPHLLSRYNFIYVRRSLQVSEFISGCKTHFLKILGMNCPSRTRLVGLVPKTQVVCLRPSTYILRRRLGPTLSPAGVGDLEDAGRGSKPKEGCAHRRQTIMPRALTKTVEPSEIAGTRDPLREASARSRSTNHVPWKLEKVWASAEARNGALRRCKRLACCDHTPSTSTRL